MGAIHHVRREFDALYVKTGLGGVARQRGDLSAMAIRQILPLHLVRCDTDEASIVRRGQC